MLMTSASSYSFVWHVSPVRGSFLVASDLVPARCNDITKLHSTAGTVLKHVKEKQEHVHGTVCDTGTQQVALAWPHLCTRMTLLPLPLPLLGGQDLDAVLATHRLSLLSVIRDDGRILRCKGCVGEC